MPFQKNDAVELVVTGRVIWVGRNKTTGIYRYGVAIDSDAEKDPALFFNEGTVTMAPHVRRPKFSDEYEVIEEGETGEDCEPVAVTASVTPERIASTKAAVQAEEARLRERRTSPPSPQGPRTLAQAASGTLPSRTEMAAELDDLL